MYCWPPDGVCFDDRYLATWTALGRAARVCAFFLIFFLFFSRLAFRFYMWRPSQLINAAVLISQFRCEDAYIPRVAFLGDISRQARVKVISFFALEPARSARSDGLGVYTVHSQVVLWTKFLNACASRAGCVRGCDRRTAMIVAHTISSREGGGCEGAEKGTLELKKVR